MRHKAKFVPVPFQGFCRRLKSGRKLPAKFNYVDNLFWKHFQTFLKGH